MCGHGSDGNTDPYSNRRGNRHPAPCSDNGCDSHAHTRTDCRTHSNTNPNAYRGPDKHPYAYADANNSASYINSSSYRNTETSYQR